MSHFNKKLLFIKNFTYCFLCLLAFIAFHLGFNLYQKIEKAKNEAINTLTNISITIDTLSNKAQILEYYIKSKGPEYMEQLQKNNHSIFDLNDFKNIASHLYDGDSIRSIQVAPNAVVSYVYPLEGNEEAIGHDLLADKSRRNDMVQAIKTGNFVVSGPLTLRQGGHALIIRNPIYYDNGEFWGASIIVFDLPNVLVPLGLSHLSSSNYLYELDCLNEGKNLIVGTTFESNPLFAASAKKEIQEKVWTLKLIPTDGWYDASTLVITISCAFIIALGLALLITKNKIVSYQITQALRKEQKIRAEAVKAYEIAKKANNAKSQFLSSMSHDIRTPMNAIIGLCILLQKDYKDQTKVLNYIDKISFSSQHLLSLINDILDIAKIDSGKATLHNQEFNLAHVINDINTIVRTQSNVKSQEFIITTNNIQHEHLIADKLRLSQILLNILSNATKYSPPHSKIIFTVTEVKSEDPTKAIFKFIIEDNGIGMTEEFIKHIYEPFARVKDDRVDSNYGTGLGMAITKHLVDLMNGTIEIDSKINVGTKITVTFDFNIHDIDNDVKYFKENNIHKILLIDDEQISYETVLNSMKNSDVHIDYANGGTKGLQLVEQAIANNDMYDCILLDWKMPGLSGTETARRIRQLNTTTPIFICTSFDFNEIEDKAQDVGINDFLIKPFFISNFIQAFKNYKSKKYDKPSQEQTKEYNILDGLRILVAEDNELNAEILVELLSMKKASCVVCKDGEEVVEKFKNAKDGEYAFILMDVHMPKLNGYEATKKIRELNTNYARRIKIIAMTANSYVEDIQASLDAGMDYHLTKPVNLKALEDLLKKFF